MHGVIRGVLVGRVTTKYDPETGQLRLRTSGASEDAVRHHNERRYTTSPKGKRGALDLPDTKVPTVPATRLVFTDEGRVVAFWTARGFPVVRLWPLWREPLFYADFREWLLWSFCGRL